MPKVEERVVIASAADLQFHFDSILPQLHLVESEDSWQKIEKSLIKLEVITKSGGYKYDSFPSLFKGVAPPIISSLLSERTKLSGTAADLINSVAPRLGERFETLVNVFLPALLLISARTNKVALVRAKKCLLLIAKHCKLVSLLPHLREGSKDKSQTARSISVEATLMLLESIESKDRLTGKRIADVETIIKGTATDRDPEVRQWCKKLFELYVEQWPDRALSFTSSFTPTTRRYLALSKSSSAPTRAAPTPTQRFSPPAVRRPQPPKEFVVKQAYGPAKARSHLGVLSTNVHAASPAVISPMLMKQKVHQSAPTSLVSSKPRSRQQQQQQQQQQAPPHAAQSNDEGQSTLKDKQEQQPQEYSQEEEDKRASLRAELLKQATGTPSQGVAARLALEKFEFQLKKSQGSSGREESAARQIHRDTDRLLFNVAMSKKQSPKKGPGRIIVTAQPPVQSTSRATTSMEASQSAQRIASSSSSNKLKSKAAAEKDAGRAEEEEEEEAEPDVFRSRPIGKARVLQPLGSGSAVSSPKVASSTTRGLGGRERLLGPSKRNANRAKLVSSSSKKNLFDKKASSLKIDLGKENIPPESMLASLAQQASEPSSPEEDAFAPGMVYVDPILPPENINRQEQVKEQVDHPVRTAHLLAEEREGRHNEDTIPSDDTLDMAAKTPLPSSSRSATPAVEKEDDKLAAALVAEGAAAGGDHALDDWAQMAQSLDAVVAPPPPPQPSAPRSNTTASSTKQGPSLSSPCKKVSNPPHFSPPSMSTPLRKPLGAIQGNGDPPSTSSASPAEKQKQEGVIIEDDRRSHTKTPAKSSASSPTKKSHSTPSAHIRKVFSLLASRKM